MAAPGPSSPPPTSPQPEDSERGSASSPRLAADPAAAEEPASVQSWPKPPTPAVAASSSPSSTEPAGPSIPSLAQANPRLANPPQPGRAKHGPTPPTSPLPGGAERGPTLLVFADSLAFHGPADPMPSNEPKLWPNVAASLLGGQARLFAGSGWTARDAWWALAGDPNVWAALPEADVLVLGVGSMDTLPSPLPSYLRAGIRYLRPDRLRRWSRTRYQAAQPQLSRLLATIGGRPVALPPHLSVRYLDDTLGAIRALRPTLPAVAILPATHIAASYGHVHPGHDPAVSAIRTWGNRRNVPLLDLTELTGEHVRSGRGNPDGMHWGWDGHEAVGTALAETVLRLTNTELPGVVATT